MQNLIYAYQNGIIELQDGSYLFSFYGIVILTGALLSLLLSNYHAHKDGFDWSFFNTVFLIAFPCGILGARIWYEIATISEPGGLGSAGSFWAGFRQFWDFRSGGLAIQGGAILGVLSGVIYVMFRRKGTPVLRITDYIVPTILIGQLFGRWGNFFNQEVFGHAVTREAWNFLPGFILNNMTNGTTAMMGGNGYIVPTVEGYSSIVAPLFFTEGVINLLFFGVIHFTLPSLEGKHYADGDQTFSYFIAYGLVRFFLEPLRNPIFIMGVGEFTDEASKTSYKSYGMAIAFIVIGAIAIIINHVIRYLMKKGVIHVKKVAPLESVVSSKSPENPSSSTIEKAENDGFDMDMLRKKQEELRQEDKKEETHHGQ